MPPLKNGLCACYVCPEGLIVVDPAGVEYTYFIRLNFPSTNNEVEYEALLAGLQIAQKIKVRALKVKVDLEAVACQLNGEFVASSEGMTKYQTKAMEHAALFKKFSIQNIHRNQNQKANVLSKLASVTFNHLTKEILVEVLNAKSVDVKEISTIVEEEGDNWITLIVKCLEMGIWPEVEKEARNLRIKISQYVMEEGVLFKKSYLDPILRCVGPLQANYVIREVHEGDTSEEINRSSECPFKSLCKKLKIKQMNTAVAHPQANGLVKRANKLLIHGFKARLGREIVGWVDELPNILWARLTMLKTSNGETPFSLTFGSEAVILAEIGMPTYRTIQFNEARNKEGMRLNLNLI
nr:reverse transcriptase domain-containing protein [Tanacetum cinerariifolium]